MRDFGDAPRGLAVVLRIPPIISVSCYTVGGPRPGMAALHRGVREPATGAVSIVWYARALGGKRKVVVIGRSLDIPGTEAIDRLVRA